VHLSLVPYGVSGGIGDRWNIYIPMLKGDGDSVGDREEDREEESKKVLRSRHHCGTLAQGVRK